MQGQNEKQFTILTLHMQSENDLLVSFRMYVQEKYLKKYFCLESPSEIQGHEFDFHFSFFIFHFSSFHKTTRLESDWSTYSGRWAAIFWKLGCSSIFRKMGCNISEVGLYSSYFGQFKKVVTLPICATQYFGLIVTTQPNLSLPQDASNLHQHFVTAHLTPTQYKPV